MKRTAMAPRTKPMKRTPIKRQPMSAWPKGRAKTLKQRQRSVSPLEKRYWDRLAQEIGCIACRVAGRATSCHVSIHHLDGRTKPGCHSLVLPLCAGCHQQGTGNDPSLIAVHPNRKRFEAMYGTQMELKQHCDALLARNEQGGTRCAHTVLA